MSESHEFTREEIRRLVQQPLTKEIGDQLRAAFNANAELVRSVIRELQRSGQDPEALRGPLDGKPFFENFDKGPDPPSEHHWQHRQFVFDRAPKIIGGE